MLVSALHKSTLKFVSSVNEVKVSNEEWIINPDLSAVEGVDKSLWVIEGNTVRQKNQDELNAILEEQKQNLINRIYDLYQECEIFNITPAGAIQLAEWCAYGRPKAMADRQWIIDLYDERDAKLDLVEAGDLSVDPHPSTPIKPFSFRELKEENDK